MAPLIPDDKATKPSIVDEMARALAMYCPHCTAAQRCPDTWANARTAAAVVARRLREALGGEAAMLDLLAELEGERPCARPGCRPGVCDAGAHLQGCPIYDNGRPL